LASFFKHRQGRVPAFFAHVGDAQVRVSPRRARINRKKAAECLLGFFEASVFKGQLPALEGLSRVILALASDRSVAWRRSLPLVVGVCEDPAEAAKSRSGKRKNP
jgi:hypothetical protein